MLNWISWNRTVFDIELTYAKLKLFEMEFLLLTEQFWHLTFRKQKLYSYKTELFEILYGIKWPERVDTP